MLYDRPEDVKIVEKISKFKVPGACRSYAIGDHIEIRGLLNSPQYNGLNGVVESGLKSGRH